MPDTVLNALKFKLARYEADGFAEGVKRVKAKIAKLEKAEKVVEPEEASAVSKSEAKRVAVQQDATVSLRKSKET